VNGLSNGRSATVEAIARARISAIIRTTDTSLARDAIQAAVDGGFRIVEFTLTTPGALELIAEFRKKSDVVVGSGTVLSIAQVRDSVSAGAQFIVSPICDPEIVAEAARLSVACIPAGFTPTELETAHRLGADFIKLFPAPAGGVEFVHSVRAPLPHLKLFPTAGITVDNFLDCLNAGCAGVGFVRALFEPVDMAARQFKVIRSRAELINQRLSHWKESSSRTSHR
jgi:Entner-Doudoroff aldolase